MPIKKRTFPADWNASARHFVQHKCRWAPFALLFEDWGTAFPGDLRPPRAGAPAAGSLLVGQGPGGKAHRPERKLLAAKTVGAQFGRAGGLVPPGGEINSPLRHSPMPWLPAPDSCSSRNEGASGDVVENTRSGRRDTGTRDTGRADSGFRSLRNAGPRGAGRACAGDGISREYAENKGTTEPNHRSPIAIRQCPGSLLLAPVLQEMKVHPEMLLKTNDRENGTRQYGTRGAQILASAFQGIMAPEERGEHAPVTG